MDSKMACPNDPFFTYQGLVEDLDLEVYCFHSLTDCFLLLHPNSSQEVNCLSFLLVEQIQLNYNSFHDVVLLKFNHYIKMAQRLGRSPMHLFSRRIYLNIFEL